MKMMRRISVLSVLALGSVLALAQIGKGDTIVVTDNTQNTFTGVYTYNVFFSASAVVNPGNGFVIYDFLGLSTASQASFAFTPSAGTVGDTFTPSLSLLGNAVGVSNPASDDPTVNNLSLVFSGTQYKSSVSGTASGILTVTSTVNGAGAGTENLIVESIDSGGGNLATSNVTGPHIGGGGSVPLPASFVGGGILMFGLAVVGMFKKMRSPSITHA
jgi:hypothetical protein